VPILKKNWNADLNFNKHLLNLNLLRHELSGQPNITQNVWCALWIQCKNSSWWRKLSEETEPKVLNWLLKSMCVTTDDTSNIISVDIMNWYIIALNFFRTLFNNCIIYRKIVSLLRSISLLLLIYIIP